MGNIGHSQGRSSISSNEEDEALSDHLEVCHSDFLPTHIVTDFVVFVFGFIFPINGVNEELKEVRLFQLDMESYKLALTLPVITSPGVHVDPSWIHYESIMDSRGSTWTRGLDNF